ncbi:MAG: ParA family protein [Candidatus Omnitrophica bacterium]|nr:ParA family protein [Candidatus Omnitrophota bacterium]
MRKVFSFCNQKGGVGKTTSAVNLATLVAKAGYKTLLIDMDSQGNATSGMGVEKASLSSTSYQLLVDNLGVQEIIVKTPVKKLDLIPANTDLSGADLELVSAERREFVLAKRLEEIEREYDFIFIDCPPSLGLVTINCLTASDALLIPLQCEYYALEGLGQLLHTYQLVKDNLNPDLDVGGVLLTMADFRTNLTQQVIEEVRNYFKEKVFDSIIPRSVKLSEAPSFGKPAVLYDPQNRASKSYVLMGKEFLKRYGPKAQAAESVVQAPAAEPEKVEAAAPTTQDKTVHQEEKRV